MALYANQSEIRIYTITFGPDAKAATNTFDTMTKMSDDTAGRHFHADTASEIIDIYDEIAGELQDTAGGSATVDMDFGVVNIGGNPGDQNLTRYMNYTPYPNPFPPATGPFNVSDSTYTNMSRRNTDGTLTILYQGIQDDTNNWTSHHMNFDVGTVKLNHYWMVNYRLKLNDTGDVNLFGPNQPNSNLTFVTNTGGKQVSTIPAIHCYIPPGSPATFSEKTLTINGPFDTLGAATIPDHWAITWNTAYNGKPGVQQGVGRLYYFNPDTIEQTRHPVTATTWMIYPPTTSESYTVDTTDTDVWKPGEKYCLEVKGTADGVNGEVSGTALCRVMPGTGTGQYLKLE
jgi:hypothetical protein